MIICSQELLLPQQHAVVDVVMEVAQCQNNVLVVLDGEEADVHKV